MRLVAAAAAAAAAPALGCLALAILAAAIGAPPIASATGGGACRLTAPQVNVRLGAEQLGDARIIQSVGRDLGVGRYGQIIALATAWQESGLRNLPFGDRDSLGLFQQRPSQGWGSPAQLLDPAYAAAAFYRRLLTVPDWKQLPLAVDAQAVQRSAYPSRYARWQPAATALEAALTGSPGVRFDCPTPAGTLPVLATPPSRAAATAISFALRQLGKPYRLPPDPPTSWDCSSLVQAAYAAAGITIPRTTYAQVTGSGPALPLQVTAWQPGDLLFSMGADPRDGLPGHVGLYLGDGQVLQAPHTGAVVSVIGLSGYGRVVAATRPWALAVADRPAR